MLEDATYDCPYCGEEVETTVDLSGGDQTYIEDCQAPLKPRAISTSGPRQQVDARIAARPPARSAPRPFCDSDMGSTFRMFDRWVKVISVVRYGVKRYEKHCGKPDHWRLCQGSRG